jgi:hypothetical protein
MDFAALVERQPGSQLAIAAVCVGFTLLAGLILLVQLWSQRGSTLVIPQAWTNFCFAVLTICMFVGLAWPNVSRTSDYRAWAFVAACGTFCPFVAMVGAKRPQHTAWSFVVVTLWGLLALPAAEVVFLQPGQRFEINAFRSWFLVALLFAEAVNFLFTRFWFATLLLLLSQVVLLAPYLPIQVPSVAEIGELGRITIGFGSLAAAMVVAKIASGEVLRATQSRFDRLWFDFRDSFGLFWALRLMERVNDTAKQAGWDFDLGWGGFRTKQDFAPLGELPAEIEQPLRNTLAGLLRRFVSDEWIAERLDRKPLTTKSEVKANP